jgi:hypothetical protein
LIDRTIAPSNVNAIASREHPQAFSINKFGRNAATAAGDGIWMPSTAFPGADTITPGVASIESSDDADNKSAATGALTVRLQGLDAAKKEIVEIVTLAGTDAVTTTLTFSRVYRVKVLTAGSGDGNAGTLTVSIGGVDVAFVAIGRNQTEQAWYTVPANCIGLITAARASFASTTVTRSADVEIACTASEDSNVVTPLNTLAMVTVGTSMPDTQFIPPIRVGPGIDTMLRCRAISAETEIHASFDLIVLRRL